MVLVEAQPVSGSANTKTAPGLVTPPMAPWGADAAIVLPSPEMATLAPKYAPAAILVPARNMTTPVSSLSASAQTPEVGLANTTTAPPADETLDMPTASVLPSSDTARSDPKATPPAWAAAGVSVAAAVFMVPAQPPEGLANT